MSYSLNSFKGWFIGGIYTPIMENQMEKNMEDKMETWIFVGVYWDSELESKLLKGGYIGELYEGVI